MSIVELDPLALLQCNLTCKKNFDKVIENSPQHLSEKFISDNLSITDIALKN